MPRPSSALRQSVLSAGSGLAVSSTIRSSTSPRASSAATTLAAAPPRSEPGSGSRLPSVRSALATASRLVAKVDSAAVQDGYDLYLHGFILADDGKWVVCSKG